MAHDQLHSICERVGEDAIGNLAAAFYDRVAKDELLRPLYPEGSLEGAETRLRDFLLFRFGGPAGYLESRGHPRLRQRHAPFAITSAARNRWVSLMNEALEDAVDDEPSRRVMREFFEAAATFLINSG